MQRIRNRGLQSLISRVLASEEARWATAGYSTVAKSILEIDDAQKFVDSIFGDDLGYVKKRLKSVLDRPVQPGKTAEELSPSEREVWQSLVESFISEIESHIWIFAGYIRIISAS